ncbi:MAG: hypothetical protein ABI707_12120 [Ferruginibacter sp.]
MKKLTIGILTVAAVISLQSVKAQTADEIIDKNVSAMGGKEKLMSLKSVKKTGNITVEGTDVGITVTVLSGVGSRNDIAVPGVGDGFQVMTAEKGWDFMPWEGQSDPQEVSADQVKSSQHLLDLPGALVNYKEKGSQVELLGKEKVDSAECYKIKLTNKLGKTYTFFIDPQTWYCVKTINKTQAPGGEEDIVTTYADFKKTDDGYVFPFAQTIPRGTITFSSIETNKPVDEKIFTVK